MPKPIKPPIMTPEQEGFMAFHMSFQWAFEVLDLGREIDRHEHAVPGIAASRPVRNGYSEFRRWGMKCQTLGTFFAVAAVNLRRNLEWARKHNQFPSVDFAEYDGLGWSDIIDVRNMQEHADEYLRGQGHSMDRCKVESSGFSADGTSTINGVIGGRLDRRQVAAVVERLLAAMSREPHPVVDWPMP